MWSLEERLRHMSITDHKPMPEGEFVRARRVEVFTGADPPILDGRREVGDCRGEFCVELERKPGSATATTNALAMFIWRREARLQSSEADIQGSCQRSLTGQMQLSDLLSSNRILAATACGSGVVRSRPASGRLCLRARPHDVVADRAPCRIQGRPSGRRLRRISGAGGQGRCYARLLLGASAPPLLRTRRRRSLPDRERSAATHRRALSDRHFGARLSSKTTQLAITHSPARAEWCRLPARATVESPTASRLATLTSS